MELGIFARVPPEYPVRGFTEGERKPRAVPSLYRALALLCRLWANFHEKALFVKADLAASVWPSVTGPALRAMLPSALSVSQLSSDSVHYGIRLFRLPRRRCNLRNGLSYS